jgi:hypothetical protein
MISYDVREKINKYQIEKQNNDKKQIKKTSKINWDVFEKLKAQGILTDNMIF